MQCIICLEEDDLNENNEVNEDNEVNEVNEDNEVNENNNSKITLLRCISSKNCTFYAHQKCILKWHNTINKYECPICHFILPNAAEETIQTRNVESANQNINLGSRRHRTIDIESDDDDFILNRIAEFNLRHNRNIAHVDSPRPRIGLARVEENLNEIHNLRDEKRYLAVMSVCILLMCFTAGMFAFFK